MFDAPVDAWYVWLGVATVSIAALGVVLALPAAAPPNASAAAAAIDDVATSPPGSTGTHQLTADEIRLDERRVGLRGPGGSASASVAFGPITPTASSRALERVRTGAPPAAVFEGPDALERTAANAREAGTGWRRAPDRVTIRRIQWEGVDVLLVG